MSARAKPCEPVTRPGMCYHHVASERDPFRAPVGEAEDEEEADERAPEEPLLADD